MPSCILSLLMQACLATVVAELESQSNKAKSKAHSWDGHQQSYVCAAPKRQNAFPSDDLAEAIHRRAVGRAFWPTTEGGYDPLIRPGTPWRAAIQSKPPAGQASSQKGTALCHCLVLRTGACSALHPGVGPIATASTPLAGLLMLCLATKVRRSGAKITCARVAKGKSVQVYQQGSHPIMLSAAAG